MKPSLFLSQFCVFGLFGDALIKYWQSWWRSSRNVGVFTLEFSSSSDCCFKMEFAWTSCLSRSACQTENWLFKTHFFAFSLWFLLWTHFPRSGSRITACITRLPCQQRVKRKHTTLSRSESFSVWREETFSSSRPTRSTLCCSVKRTCCSRKAFSALHSPCWRKSVYNKPIIIL